ncbi:MAG: hypothetical protein AAB583_07025 [Patescibacteria group bacterium]
MESRINTEIQSLRIIYNRNKHYIIPVVVIFVSIVLVILVVIPQFKTLLKVREQAKQASIVLDRLKKDLGVLESQDKEILESQLRTSNLALPTNKEVGGILNALYTAAERSGVSIGRFSFQVGNLGSEDKSNVKFSTIGLSLSLDSGILAINSFIDIIGKTLPISDISAIKTDDNVSNISLLFYYRALPQTNVSSRIMPISQKNLELLSKINDYNNATEIALPAESASVSAKSTNPFLP